MMARQISIAGNDYIAKVNIPDALTATTGEAATARIYFTYVSNFRYNRPNRVWINGTAITLPPVPDKPNVGVHWNGDATTIQLSQAGYPTSASIPINLLKRGNNDIKFEVGSDQQTNLRVALFFPAGKAPAYTQPETAAPGLGYPGPTYPKFGA